MSAFVYGANDKFPLPLGIQWKEFGLQDPVPPLTYTVVGNTIVPSGGVPPYKQIGGSSVCAGSLTRIEDQCTAIIHRWSGESTLAITCGPCSLCSGNYACATGGVPPYKYFVDGDEVDPGLCGIPCPQLKEDGCGYKSISVEDSCGDRAFLPEPTIDIVLVLTCVENKVVIGINGLMIGKPPYRYFYGDREVYESEYPDGFPCFLANSDTCQYDLLMVRDSCGNEATVEATVPDPATDLTVVCTDAGFLDITSAYGIDSIYYGDPANTVDGGLNGDEYPCAIKDPNGVDPCNDVFLPATIVDSCGNEVTMSVPTDPASNFKVSCKDGFVKVVGGTPNFEYFRGNSQFWPVDEDKIPCFIQDPNSTNPCDLLGVTVVDNCGLTGSLSPVNVSNPVKISCGSTGILIASGGVPPYSYFMVGAGVAGADLPIGQLGPCKGSSSGCPSNMSYKVIDACGNQATVSVASGSAPPDVQLVGTISGGFSLITKGSPSSIVWSGSGVTIDQLGKVLSFDPCAGSRSVTAVVEFQQPGQSACGSTVTLSESVTLPPMVISGPGVYSNPGAYSVTGNIGNVTWTYPSGNCNNSGVVSVTDSCGRTASKTVQVGNNRHWEVSSYISWDGCTGDRSAQTIVQAVYTALGLNYCGNWPPFNVHKMGGTYFCTVPSANQGSSMESFLFNPAPVGCAPCCYVFAYQTNVSVCN